MLVLNQFLLKTRRFSSLKKSLMKTNSWFIHQWTQAMLNHRVSCQGFKIQIKQSAVLLTLIFAMKKEFEQMTWLVFHQLPSKQMKANLHFYLLFLHLLRILYLHEFEQMTWIAFQYFPRKQMKTNPHLYLLLHRLLWILYMQEFRRIRCFRQTILRRILKKKWRQMKMQEFEQMKWIVFHQFPRKQMKTNLYLYLLFHRLLWILYMQEFHIIRCFRKTMLRWILKKKWRQMKMQEFEQMKWIVCHQLPRKQMKINQHLYFLFHHLLRILYLQEFHRIQCFQ